MEEELELAKKRCKVAIDRIERLQNRTKKITPSQCTLTRLALSELAFLCRSSSLHTSLSVNIGHIEAVLHILQHPFINGVSRVCKPIPFSSKTVHVDIVCTLNANPVWIIVSDGNPNYISWNGSHKTKGLRSRIEQTLVAARSSLALKPRSIVLFFSKGLDTGIFDKARDEFGAQELGLEFSVFDFDFYEDIESDWVNILVRTFREAFVIEIKVDENSIDKAESNPESVSHELVSDENGYLARGTESSFFSVISRISIRDTGSGIINFDTTALIALVSGISNNGGTNKLLATPEVELRRRFKGNYEFVIEQVMSEIESPIHVELSNVLSGKKCIICRTVCSEFKELVSMCGGPNEKSRADQLLSCLMVGDDSPSERMMSLRTTRKVAMKNKIVFGTGDYWGSPTLTANMAFVRAISQTGMSLFTIAHQPRALTGD